MAISPRAVGAWAYAASGSVTPTLPTHVAGDMLFVRVAFKSSAIATCAASVATAGWTKLGEFHNGTTNSGNGTGSVGVAHFWKVATSAAETNPTVAFSQAVTQVGHSAVTFQKGTDEAWLDPVGDGGGFASSTSASATIQSHVSVISGDMVVFFIASCDDTAFTVPTITQTGVTFAAVTEYPATAGLDATGADGSYDAGYRLATAGTSSAAAVVTATLAAAETGSAWMTRLRVAAGTKIYPTTTSSTVATASLDQVAWTTRSSGVASSYVDTVAGPTAPIQSGTASGGAGDDWFTTTLTAFSLTDPVIVEVRARESHTNNNAQVLAELARVDGDGTNPSVWATTSANVELTDSEAAYRLVLTGSSLAISNGQRLRIRFYFDDAPSLNMAAAGAGARVVYGATSAGAAGDTYVVFSQTLTEFTAGTSAAAQLATATGAALVSAASIAVNTPLISATGSAYDATVTTSKTVAAEVASGTGWSGDAMADWQNGQGARPSVSPNAGIGLGTGLANNATASVVTDTNAAAGVATGTGAAANMAATVAPNAGTGTGTGAALNATVSVATATNAAAVTATGTGAASNVSASVKPTAGQAAGTGLANNPAVSVKPNAATATGTGAAYGVTASTTDVAPAEVASGSGASANPSVSLKVNAGVGAGTGAALASSVSTTDEAPAGTATGSGVAYPATTLIVTNAALAQGSGASDPATPAVAVNAQTTAGTGAAHNAAAVTAVTATAGTAVGSGAALAASVSIAVTAGSGTGTGAANDAVAATGSNVFASAGTAAGTGAAGDSMVNWQNGQGASSTIAPNAGVATGTGQANNAFALVPGDTIASAGVATGSGTAHNAFVTANYGVGTPPSGATYYPKRPVPKRPAKLEPEPKPKPALVYAYAQVARGRGTAFNAKTEWNDDDTALSLLLDLELVA